MKKSQAELIKELSDKEIVFHLYFTQLLLIFLSVVLGIFFINDIESFLALWHIYDWKILYIGGVTALIVIIIDLLLMKWLPSSIFDDGGINERLFQKRNILHIFFLCVLISFTEEILFRGIIQSSFGIYIASIVFALLHLRYLTKWVLLLAIIILSFVLGIIFELTSNLWVTVFAHFLIDFVFASKIRFDYLKYRRGEENGT